MVIAALVDLAVARPVYLARAALTDASWQVRLKTCLEMLYQVQPTLARSYTGDGRFVQHRLSKEYKPNETKQTVLSFQQQMRRFNALRSEYFASCDARANLEAWHVPLTNNPV